MSDDELIRYLDGEMDGRETGLLLERLRAEPASAARLEQLQVRSWRLSALLRHADPSEAETRRAADAIRPATRVAPATQHVEPRGAWSRAPIALRAAAVVLLLLAGALAAPPARAWIAHQLRVAADALVPDRTPLPAPATPPPAVTPALSIAFPVAGDTFEIRVPGPGGTLLVRRPPRDDGAIEVTGADIADHLVRSGGLRLEGAASADARYVLDLPPRVATIRVRVGDEAPMLHALPAGAAEVEIDLTR